MNPTPEAKTDAIQKVYELPIEFSSMVKRVLLGHAGEANPIRRERLGHEVARRRTLGR